MSQEDSPRGLTLSGRGGTERTNWLGGKKKSAFGVDRENWGILSRKNGAQKQAKKAATNAFPKNNNITWGVTAGKKGWGGGGGHRTKGHAGTGRKQTGLGERGPV